MSTEKIISRHTLPNGLTLEFWDFSRPMAGDRWLVAVEARVTIPVNAATLPPELGSREAEIVETLGAEIVYSQQDGRTFVDAGQLQETLHEIKDRLLALAPSYLGHPEFAGRFIRKKFAETRERQRWQAAQDESAA